MGEKTGRTNRAGADKSRDFNVLSKSVAQLTAKARLYEHLLHLFSDVSNARRNLGLLLDAVMEAIPSEAGSVLMADPEEQDYFFVAARGPVAAKVLKLRLAPGQGIVGAAVADKTTLAVSDVTKEPRFARDISKALGFPTRSLLATPIIHKGDAIGALELVNKEGGDVWTKADIALFERAARVAADLTALGHR